MLAPLQAAPLANSSPLRAPETRGYQRSAGVSVAPIPAQGSFAARASLSLEQDERQAALLEAIYEARTTLKVELSALCEDSENLLLKALARRAEQGVRVQVLAPIKMTTREEKAQDDARQQGLLVRASIGLDRARSLVIADDRVALLFQGALRLAGEAAWELGRSFNQAWALAGGSPASLPDRPALFSSTRSSSVRFGGGAHRAVKGVLAAALGAAQDSIDLHLEALSDVDLLAVLKAAQSRGVNVRVLLAPRTEQAAWSSLAAIRDAGLAVRQAESGLPAQGAVVDGTAVVLSSCAWTTAALDNATALDVRQEIELHVWADAFETAWDNADEPALSTVARIAAKLVPAAQTVLLVLSRLAQRNWSIPALHVGVVQVAGRWRVLAETR